MAEQLPKFIAIKSAISGCYASYMTEPKAVRGAVFCCEESVLNPMVKVAVERAQTDSKFVHLRFCHTNKYWGRAPAPAPADKDESDHFWVQASTDQPEEDTSKWSCTLFEPSFRSDGTLNFTFVPTRRRMRTNSVDSWDVTYRVLLDDNEAAHLLPTYDFTFVDWDTLVVLPKHVAFKGCNDKYLKAGWIESHEYLQFSSDEGNEEATSYEITMHPNGHVRIKSNLFGKFWQCCPNWIWADLTDAPLGRTNTSDALFWPVRVDGNAIALRSASNNKFCSSLTTEGKTDCLNAAVNTITSQARLMVEELVFEREIFDVVYHMEFARIFDVRNFILGTGSAINESSETTPLNLRVSFQHSSSSTFSNSSSITTGVPTKIRTGFSRIIADGKIEVSAEVTTPFEWNRPIEEAKTVEASYAVVVPPRSRVRVNYVATRGTCNIPFSYTQRERRSSNGSVVTSRHIDGVYTGTNFYNFHFEQLQVEPL